MTNKLLNNGSILFALTIFLLMSYSANAQYCIPQGVNSNRYIDNFATTGGIQNISNLISGFSTGGYGDFTTMAVQVNPGDELSFESDVLGGTAGFRIWVDWNHDGTFDQVEEVAYHSTGYSNSPSGSFTVPMDVASGETRMRIVSHWLSTTGEIDPCATGFTYGEFEDYTFIVAGSDEPFPSPYCDIAGAEDVIVEEITKVSFGDAIITNTDTDSVLVDKTDTVVDLSAGATYTLSVEGNTHGDFETNIVAFIDWNQNGILDDTGEIYELGTLENSTGTDGISVSLAILVPADAVLGNTRIRITKTYFDDLSNAIINPCGIEFDPFGWGIESGYGQALDFTLNLEAGNTDNCEGTPIAGVATVNPESGYVDTQYTVAATGFTTGSGLTYQWQSNTDNAGWVHEGNVEDVYSAFTATAPSVSGIVVEWRLEVICTLSSEISYSEVATFTTTEPSLYCIPLLDCGDGDNITNVTFQEINNTTTCSDGGYGDYTAMSATVQAGGTYPISISVGDGWDVESASVWVDFDNSGSFDEDEFFFIGTGSGEALPGNISIPSGLENGDYRMRVRVIAGPGADATWDLACDSEDVFGETEDYTVTVDGLVGIEENSISNFTYYPNPVQDVLYISAKENVQSLSAYNVLGQEVLSSKDFANGQVDVSSLPNGTFMFRVTFENGFEDNFKILKK